MSLALLCRFPAMDQETIGDMLRENGGHMERTCEQVARNASALSPAAHP